MWIQSFSKIKCFLLHKHSFYVVYFQFLDNTNSIHNLSIKLLRWYINCNSFKTMWQLNSLCIKVLNYYSVLKFLTANDFDLPRTIGKLLCVKVLNLHELGGWKMGLIFDRSICYFLFLCFQLLRAELYRERFVPAADCRLMY